MKIATLKIDVVFDEAKTDDESVATAMDRLMETATSTPGILDDYGEIRIGEFTVDEVNPRALTAEDIRMLKYFWVEMGNLGRWSGWNEALPSIKKQIPELLEALKKREDSILEISRIIQSLHIA